MPSLRIVTAIIWLCMAPIAVAEPQHAISMHGTPALPADYAHLDYVDPDAPKGGRITLGEVGGFDSLHPFIIKGTAPWALRGHVFESLLGRSRNEPFTLYGLLAETVETDSERGWVSFTLRPEARFSDGSPVTVEDVIFSMETLAAKGRPNYGSGWSNVAKVERISERAVRFVFKTPDRELPLILGLRPILKAADWADVDFEASALRVPIGSGPYPVAEFEAGRFISYVRDPDHWGRDLAFYRGQNNIDEIRYEFFRDRAAMFEAFRSGALSFYREGRANAWASDYAFDAVTKGDVIQAEIPHQRPTGMYGFVFNTRQAMFQDIRVRKALTHAFNFEFMNSRLNRSVFPRIKSYFANSRLGVTDEVGPVELALLEPFLETLPPDILTPHVLPPGTTRPVDRKALREARALLTEAGWQLVDGVLVDAAGMPFEFEIMLRATDNEAVAAIYAEALKPLGITVTARLVDNTQYNQRRTAYEYDMLVNRWAQSLSPGYEQRFYWGSDGRDAPGTRNYAGIADPAVDALIETLVVEPDEDRFVATVRALDRVLSKGYYVIPFWFADKSWIAFDARLKRPVQVPLYGDWPGYFPDVWWIED